MSKLDSLIIVSSAVAAGGCFYLTYAFYKISKDKEYSELTREMAKYSSLRTFVTGIVSSGVGLWFYLNPLKTTIQK